MWLIVVGLLQVLSPASGDLEEQSKSQAEHYISSIEEESHIEENLWALALLGSEHDEVAAYIEQEVERRDITSGPLLPFKDVESSFRRQLEKVVFQTGSSDLLISLLLESDDKEAKKKLYNRFKENFPIPDSTDYQRINYPSLFNMIIEGEEITENVLPSDTFILPHFFVIYYNTRKPLLSNSYLRTVSTEWSLSSSLPEDQLSTTLQRVSYFNVYYLLDNYSETAELYNSIVNIPLFPNSSVKSYIFRFLDYSMYRLGYYDRNLEIARNHTVPLAQYLGLDRLELITKFSTGINLYSIGKMHEAEEVYQELIAEKDQDYFNLSLSSLYNNLALTYHNLGKYDEYLDLQYQALQNSEEANDYNHQLEIMNNLFIYFRQLNDSESALQYLTEAQNIAEQEGLKEDLGRIYANIGSAHINFDLNYQKAHSYFKKAFNTLDPDNDVLNYKDVLNAQSQAYEEQGELTKALTNYDQIIALAPEDNNPIHIDALVNKAMIYLELDDINQAKKLIKQYKSFDLSQLDFSQLVKAETVEADYLYRTGETEQALTILQPMLEQIVDRAKSSGDLETGHWHVENEYLDAFELTTSILIDDQQQEKAVEILDQLKTVNDASLYQNPLVRSSLLDESELTQYKQLTAQLDESRKRLLAAEEEDQFAIQQTINRLNNKKSRFDRRLTKQVEKDPVTVRDVQNKLSAYELVLHVTELNDRYYISHISRSGVSVDIIPFDDRKRELLEGSLEQVATHKTNLDSLYEVTQMLSLQDLPDHIRKVTIIPDTYLYQLPVDILPLDKPTYKYSYGETSYFIEQFETRYLTSLNDFGDNPAERPPSRFSSDFVGYGVSEFNGRGQQSLVPLPFAETEIKTISSNFTNLSEKQTFIDQASTKERFNKTAAEGRILHLATHSEISERDPLFSSIQMDNSASPGNEHGDQIYAYELFQLNLNNELIMMNSCESGTGGHLQGTGVMGISRALQYAGAQSLILNLWSVNDMLASDFAIHFYELLNEGKSKAQALRDTKRYFLENKNASPHFWGPYMLIGDDEPVVSPNRNINLVVAGTFSLYFLLMVSLSYLKSQGLIFSGRKNKAA